MDRAVVRFSAEGIGEQRMTRVQENLLKKRVADMREEHWKAVEK